MENSAVNLKDNLSMFSEYLKPKVVSIFNEFEIMLIKSKGGDLNWNFHKDTDNILVIKRKIRIKLCNGEVLLWTGEIHVVPKGVEHEKVENEGVHLLLIEPKGTPNTADHITKARKISI